MLSPIRYKNYVWPHNPTTFEVEYSRTAAKRKLPMSGFSVQDMGRSWRIFRGEGEFVGENAYAQFEKLAEVFNDDCVGLLIHPVWKSVWALFTKLSLRQEPRADYVKYSFEFTEYGGIVKNPALTRAPANAGISDAMPQIYTVVAGDTLGAIAAGRGLTLSRILEKNPQIKNANLISPGDKIMIG